MRTVQGGMVALGGLVLLVAAVRAGITVTPSSYDFGNVAVGASKATDFRIQLSPTTPPATLVLLSYQGMDKMDFGTGTVDTIPIAMTMDCSSTSQGQVCTKTIAFYPKILGPRHATLVISDGRGNQVTVPLKGNGVAPICTNRVVFCNYAHLYSGTFGWNRTLNGPNSQYKETVEVTITNGVAVCNGSATSSGQGTSQTGAITGKGLFAVEWLDDPMYPWVYQITAACPTPDWPAGPNGEAATPSQPAELGHNDQSTYKQSDILIKPGMTLEQAIDVMYRIQGTLTYPAPETDQLNGVSGGVVVSWSLVRS
jgi:hypothetical protein